MKNFNEIWKKYLSEADLDTSNLVIKDHLYEKFWKNEKLLKEVADQLMEIALNFAESADIEEKIEDITITGSIAAFNWHAKSDIDLHILVDFRKLKGDEDTIRDLMMLRRVQWNKDHKIMILGHEVEIYIQNTAEDHFANGVYSLKNKKWIETPTREDVKFDLDQVLNKSESIIDEINAISNYFLRKKYKTAYKYAEKMKEKLRKLRSSGLESDGVYSIENLTFKVLRNNGYLERLSTLKTLSYDNMMSIANDNKVNIDINKVFKEFINSSLDK